MLEGDLPSPNCEIFAEILVRWRESDRSQSLPARLSKGAALMIFSHGDWAHLLD